MINFDHNKEIEIEQKKPSQTVFEWLEIFIVSVAAVFILFSFVARIAVVDGNSMHPTLSDNDKLLVRQIFYEPKQGDIIVCQSENYGLDKPLVKRIIATEGQTVRLDLENWKIYVDGFPLEEPYIVVGSVPMRNWEEHFGDEITVPDGHVFVMGDNRNDSLDSRYDDVGFIDERYIIGQVIYRFLPFDGFGPVE
ncbi:MAG: signal peptidase I [Clostridia bacterium]|nr:signal peptidase I [Clostridia bacterium]